jgi:hypothetical protein
MTERDYLVFGDTFVNTVFADARRWKARFGGLPTTLRPRP